MFNFIQFVFSLLFLVFIIRFLKNRPSGRGDISDINPNRDLRINKHSEIVPSDLRTVMDKTFRGNIFENRVKDYLLNNYNKLLVLTNCVFVENGKSCEVDLLVFTVQGLISIECKSFNDMVV